MDLPQNARDQCMLSRVVARTKKIDDRNTQRYDLVLFDHIIAHESLSMFRCFLDLNVSLLLLLSSPLLLCFFVVVVVSVLLSNHV